MHYVFLLIICVSAVEASSLKGKPVPAAKMLDQVLSRYLNKSDYTDTIFEFLRGDDVARRKSVDLDLGVLDRDNVQRIINNIKTRYHSENHRRYTNYDAFYPTSDNNVIKVTALDMMKQSIYAAKYRLNETKRFRKMYTDNASFHIAMYYGALMQVSNKLETLYTIIKKLVSDRTHFLWYLVIYEKILAANVDAHDMVDRIFDLNEKHQKRLQSDMVDLAPTIPTTPGTTARVRRRRTRTTSTEMPPIGGGPKSHMQMHNYSNMPQFTGHGMYTEPNEHRPSDRPDTERRPYSEPYQHTPPPNYDEYRRPLTGPRNEKRFIRRSDEMLRGGRLINMQRYF